METKNILLFTLFYMSAINSYILIVNNNTKISAGLKNYMKSRNLDYIAVDKNSDLNSKIVQNKNKIDGVILSGGPLLYSQKEINLEDINPNVVALVNLDCPILGICFGHQTLAKIFGGAVSKMTNLVKGKEKINILKDAEIFKYLPNEIEMQQNHNDCVSELPSSFEIVATSQSCAIEAIKHKTKSIFGVQFHPELSGEVGYQLLDNFIKLCE